MFHIKQIGTFCSKIFVMNKFKDRLRELRVEKNISRKRLAKELFVSVRLVSYWEKGERECSFDMLITLAKYFNVSVDYLLGVVDF